MSEKKKEISNSTYKKIVVLAYQNHCHRWTQEKNFLAVISVQMLMHSYQNSIAR